jgi:hypothetical protein
MIYPKGEPIYENLSSEYTDVLQLLSSLKSEGFSGSIEIVSSGTNGVLLISSGDIIEAILDIESNPTLMGDEAVEELMVLCTQQASIFSVYKLTSEEVDFLATTAQSENTFKDLSTDFVRLDRFVNKLQDEKHTGYIEVSDKNNKVVYILLFKNGLIEGAFVHSESDKPEFKKGKEAQDYMKKLADQSLFISVYRTGSAVPGEIVKEAARTPSPPPANEVVKKSDSWREVKEAITSDLEKAVNAVVAAGGRASFISDIQEIFRKLERIVTDISEKGGFRKILGRVCVEKSEIYPFLDPFDGQFEYSGGILTIADSVPFDTLCAGLASCLNQTLMYLQKEMPKVFVMPQGFKGEIEFSFSDYSDILQNAGIHSIVP